ncbi:hypothetical protein K493DRAFT_32112 [Basidiobolus meristosporus CBS 931.73]|uniref:Uncharacterized protein n=1 Tax=Basidiobolus meristosporus CBS 931.73 TaxID=1314790 RepID=A0A1Y1Y8J2_9FUNG|nr:hypothetical protein K493DRAFT_32112 [Basidiobolus meristosporus CBS 931.73]|eukprot:ORX94195.1 hypothetical protein K493DRAFT_32112 [Basidiobolus meristosporus CBS 931.73]
MDTNWCTVCDKHIDFDGLYCSQQCRLQDAKSDPSCSPTLTYENRRTSICSVRSPTSPKIGFSSPPLSPVYRSYPSEKISPPHFSLSQHCGRSYGKVSPTFAKRLYAV